MSYPRQAPPDDELVAFLQSYSGQESGDLQRLDEIVEIAVSRPRTQSVDDALFGIFERFPKEDGHGIYWSILHGLERRGDYETALLASLRRTPTEFAVRMLGRMCNAGASLCADDPRLRLLRDIANAHEVDEDVRGVALRFLDHVPP